MSTIDSSEIREARRHLATLRTGVDPEAIQALEAFIDNVAASIGDIRSDTRSQVEASGSLSSIPVEPESSNGDQEKIVDLDSAKKIRKAKGLAMARAIIDAEKGLIRIDEKEEGDMKVAVLIFQSVTVRITIPLGGEPSIQVLDNEGQVSSDQSYAETIKIRAERRYSGLLKIELEKLGVQ